MRLIDDGLVKRFRAKRTFTVNPLKSLIDGLGVNTPLYAYTGFLGGIWFMLHPIAPSRFAYINLGHCI
jgi:hypothetical protein